MIEVVPAHSAEKALVFIEDEGYQTGPEISKEVIVLEKQKVQVCFRGGFWFTGSLIFCLGDIFYPRLGVIRFCTV